MMYVGIYLVVILGRCATASVSLFGATPAVGTLSEKEHRQPGGLHVFPEAAFTHSGHIIGIAAHYIRTNTFHVGVWSQAGPTSFALLNSTSVTPPSAGLHVTWFDESQKIRFSPGNVYGYASGGSTYSFTFDTSSGSLAMYDGCQITSFPAYTPPAVLRGNGAIGDVQDGATVTIDYATNKLFSALPIVELDSVVLGDYYSIHSRGTRYSIFTISTHTVTTLHTCALMCAALSLCNSFHVTTTAAGGGGSGQVNSCELGYYFELCIDHLPSTPEDNVEFYIRVAQ